MTQDPFHQDRQLLDLMRSLLSKVEIRTSNPQYPRYSCNLPLSKNVCFTLEYSPEENKYSKKFFLDVCIDYEEKHQQEFRMDFLGFDIETNSFLYSQMKVAFIKAINSQHNKKIRIKYEDCINKKALSKVLRTDQEKLLIPYLEQSFINHQKTEIILKEL